MGIVKSIYPYVSLKQEMFCKMFILCFFYVKKDGIAILSTH